MGRNTTDYSLQAPLYKAVQSGHDNFLPITWRYESVGRGLDLFPLGPLRVGWGQLLNLWGTGYVNTLLMFVTFSFVKSVLAFK
jgi:hypothetical protein